MSYIARCVESVVLSIGGVGLFFIAFLDSSVLSLPEINDLLVVTLAIREPDLRFYYAAMATFGSVVGCLVLYSLGRKGESVVFRGRFTGERYHRTLALAQRYGALAVAIPAVLPPPTPFKVFVFTAGVARVQIWKFVIAVFLGRGIRYFTVAFLAVRYGEEALTFIKSYLTYVESIFSEWGVAALINVVFVLVAAWGILFWVRRKRSRQR